MKNVLKSNLLSLGVLVGLSFILIYITNKYILSIGFYNNSEDIFSGIPARDVAMYNAWQKWIYLTELIFLLIKVNLITLILYTALFLTDVQVNFKKLLNIVIYCDYIFLVPAALKIVWFIYGHPNGTMIEWHKTYILSAISLFDEIPADWSYSLQVINLFEISYWFILAYGISRITRLNFDNSLKIVVSSYLPALLIWVATVSYCMVVLFPLNG